MSVSIIEDDYSNESDSVSIIEVLPSSSNSSTLKSQRSCEIIEEDIKLESNSSKNNAKKTKIDNSHIYADEYLNVFLNPSSEESQRLINNSSYIRSDETISTGYTTNTQFEPEVSLLNYVMFGTPLEPKNENQDVEQQIDKILCDTSINLIESKIQAVKNVFESKDRQILNVVMRRLLNHIDESEQIFSEIEAIISSLIPDSITVDSIISALEYFKKSCEGETFKYQEALAMKFFNLIGFLYVQSVKRKTKKNWLLTVRNYSLELVENWSKLRFLNVNRDALVCCFKLKCVEKFLNVTLDALKQFDIQFLNRIYDNVKLVNVNSSDQRLRKASLDVIDVLVQSYFKN